MTLNGNDLGVSGSTDFNSFFVTSVDSISSNQTIIELYPDISGGSRQFIHANGVPSVMLRGGTVYGTIGDGVIAGSDNLAPAIPSITSFERESSNGTLSMNGV